MAECHVDRDVHQIPLPCLDGPGELHEGADVEALVPRHAVGPGDRLGGPAEGRGTGRRSAARQQEERHRATRSGDEENGEEEEQGDAALPATRPMATAIINEEASGDVLSMRLQIQQLKAQPSRGGKRKLAEGSDSERHSKAPKGIVIRERPAAPTFSSRSLEEDSSSQQEPQALHDEIPKYQKMGSSSDHDLERKVMSSPSRTSSGSLEETDDVNFDQLLVAESEEAVRTEIAAEREHVEEDDVRGSGEQLLRVSVAGSKVQNLTRFHIYDLDHIVKFMKLDWGQQEVKDVDIAQNQEDVAEEVHQDQIYVAQEDVLPEQFIFSPPSIPVVDSFVGSKIPHNSSPQIPQSHFAPSMQNLPSSSTASDSIPPALLTFLEKQFASVHNSLDSLNTKLAEPASQFDTRLEFIENYLQTNINGQEQSYIFTKVRSDQLVQTIGYVFDKAAFTQAKIFDKIENIAQELQQNADSFNAIPGLATSLRLILHRMNFLRVNNEDISKDLQLMRDEFNKVWRMHDINEYDDSNQATSSAVAPTMPHGVDNVPVVIEAQIEKLTDFLNVKFNAVQIYLNENYEDLNFYLSRIEDRLFPRHPPPP
ncbi:hypothetical protein Taro_000206 [Colocasia esculenta]|uniref:Uncharacterized protein n=1 Tax=Colocasia esculenta TaxID=4460 RepID=A0A843TCB2_COLES|nr:hypothetical protein [Colocasia esculenta]